MTTVKAKPNSLASLARIFNKPALGCDYPVDKMLNENHYDFPIEFYFGDKDWMDKVGAEQLEREQTGGNTIYCRVIEKCGHQIPEDNPERMVKYLIEGAENRRCE